MPAQMASNILITNDPHEIKKSLGMSRLWREVKNGAATKNSIASAKRHNQNQGIFMSRQFLSDSSFAVLSQPSQDSFSLSKDTYLPDISKYIPVGSIRIHKNDCLFLNGEISSCQSWHAFHLPADINNFQHNILYLPNTLQGKLLHSAPLDAFNGIHNAGWIRMEFRARNHCSGQVRVYILPNDIGNAVLDRSTKRLRKGMEALLDKLDVSHATWQGTWSDDEPIQHINSTLNADQSTDNVSLFDMFNTLSSPKPDPQVVVDEYVQDAMRSILDGSITGLHPDIQMHPYQCQTAAMMLQRESQPAYLLDPRLRELKDQAGNNFYCDLSANACLREPRFYEAPRGGICAENMGLGKTLICLALILATKDLRSQIPVENSLDSTPVRPTTGSLLDMSASTIGRLGIPWEIILGKMESEEGIGFSRMRDALKRGIGYYWYTPDPPRRDTRNPRSTTPRKIWLSKATLVVIPANLVQQWIQEIEKHTIGLKYLIMDDMKVPLPAANVLTSYDIILFSKKRFEREAKEEVLSARQRTTSCQHSFETPEADNCPCTSQSDLGQPGEILYRSPLRDLHFKRLINDEGHSFGNVTKNSKSDAIIMIDFLHLDARWIISGTPTHGLHGEDIIIPETNDPPTHSIEIKDREITTNSPEEIYPSQQKLFIEQETKDLENLGNILTSYLKARPWANKVAEGDQAAWTDLVIKPRNNRQIHGDSQILKSTLESMIIRHTAKDINEQLSLPPLHKKIVYLEGCLQDKLSLNIFSMMIVINALTSEREGVDYLFHPKSRGALQALVSNLRQASFTWSGHTALMIEKSLDTAKEFIRKNNIAPEDRTLLQEAIYVGECAVINGIFTATSHVHEMAMYVQNNLQQEIRAAWALDHHDEIPTLMGATMVLGAKDVFNCASRTSLYGEGVWQREIISYGEQMRSQIESGGHVDPAQFRKSRMASKGPILARPFCLANGRGSTIISTASSKLSYLMDQIFFHHILEKIIVFYEAENVGYYIAQALKCMNVKHLLYSKRDSTSERSKCVVKFNSLPNFRVMLMDVNQAAFGLDMSAASRVYFVNPVFSPQIEAQAIKRAHRIGQLHPVHVETLVLKGSIEEVILARRGVMSDQEHMKLKDILDDQTLYDWIRNARFFPMPSGPVPGPQQLAPLTYPQPAFVKPALDSDAWKSDLATQRELRANSLARAGSRFSRSLFPGTASTIANAELRIQVQGLSIEVQHRILRHYREGLDERMHDQEVRLSMSVNGPRLPHRNMFLEGNSFTSGESY
ncbi:e80fca16-73ea-4ed9-acac-21bd7879202c [Sclerotinia trifoliorum]|uniref:E80fca16-73ea-4ed9-acac-21bd7879202c n=1 Tax=Sclerotinia trifoliorum TaxID=28548 RepID=A0A8H2VL82_9HELO|nr:e80fca16-73ea-4ed9-acac-21bd7879202c [Sclerotinia trifoliorum]